MLAGYPINLVMSFVLLVMMMRGRMALTTCEPILVGLRSIILGQLFSRFLRI